MADDTLTDILTAPRAEMKPSRRARALERYGLEMRFADIRQVSCSQMRTQVFHGRQWHPLLQQTL